MKFSFFLLILSIICLQGISQSINNQAIERVNVMSADYVAIEGTQLSIKLPKGFVKSERFVGYEHKIAGSSIVVSEFPAKYERISSLLGR